MSTLTAATLLERQRVNICSTYVNVINVKDLGLEAQPQRLGLLDRVGQLTVGLRTDRKHTQHEDVTNELA